MLLDNKKKKLFDEAYSEYLIITKIIEEVFNNATANPFEDERSSVTDVVCNLDLYLQSTLLNIAVADGQLADEEIDFIMSLPDELDEVCSRNRGYKRYLRSITVESHREYASKYFDEQQYPVFLKIIQEEDDDAVDGVIESIEKILNLFAAIDDDVSERENAVITKAVTFLRGNRKTGVVKKSITKVCSDKNVVYSKDLIESELDQFLIELNNLIGLENVKRDVLANINLLKINNLRKEKGLPELQTSRHMVFTGQPGTGKTTVARIMANIYKTLGVVSKGHLVETDRSGLVAGYVGQTALKTAQVIKKAKGGILFIDEAYSLTPDDSRNDFGKEVVDTLVKGMEDYRDDLVVIVAGYTDEMTKFIDVNPGLRSRFNKFINFDDYTGNEMLEIFKGLCNKAQFILSSEAENKALKYFMNHQGDKFFGNARGVRNYFESVITTQAARILSFNNPTEEEFRTIQFEDVL